MVSRMAMAYFGGAIGALLASMVLWVVAEASLLSRMGVYLAPPFSWEWFAPRLLWGSLFGLGYPIVRRQGFTPVRTGLVLSLLPSAVELLILMPSRSQGVLGVGLGALTPVVILVINAFWGWCLARVMISKGSS